MPYAPIGSNKNKYRWIDRWGAMPPFSISMPELKDALYNT
jgi:hypothetical protein